MSTYTSQLRFICESLAGFTESQGFHSAFDGQGSVYNLSKDKLWDFDYSEWIPELAEREQLQYLFMSYFYDREIGYETFGLWHLHFREQWIGKMPKLYSQLKADKMMLSYSPDSDVKNKTTTKGKNSNSGSDVTETTGHSEGQSDQAFSDTPQGKLSGVEDLNYLSEYTKNTNSSEGSGKNTTTHGLVTDTESETTYEGSGNISDSIMKYRQASYNTRLDFVKSFENLFMQIY